MGVCTHASGKGDLQQYFYLKKRGWTTTLRIPNSLFNDTGQQP